MGKAKIMSNENETPKRQDTNAWVFHSWLSFGLSVVAMAVGIIYLPVNNWVKGYMAMGTLFTVGSTINLSKTVRDQHENKRLISRVDEARLEKLLAENHPWK